MPAAIRGRGRHPVHPNEFMLVMIDFCKDEGIRTKKSAAKST